MSTPPEHTYDDGPDPRHQAADQVEELARANEASNATMLQLVEQVRKDAELRGRKVDLLEGAQRQTRKVLILVGIALAAILVIGVINAVNIYSTQRNAAVIAATAKDANGTYSLLLDCLNSRGECGRRNAEQSVKTLDEVKVYQLTVLYCVRINPASEDPNGDAFVACVNRLYPGGPQLKGR